jgi:hypothetical protein
MASNQAVQPAPQLNKSFNDSANNHEVSLNQHSMAAITAVKPDSTREADNSVNLEPWRFFVNSLANNSNNQSGSSEVK